ncbi:IclR family transcriptional regulator [Amycolatopsis sp. K13G38]|uniref:IclR family transcriptional regulator n=1 Tax=Amycolatopsis acididurans TaxID=2724524 RepID=A0ABX1JCZ9_9PSEU|nr:IclR family transcriptional regulator [Amycolatopsis acididurans]NKQ57662.1 IclR family transcriptional regulator [Amycolatopsis acididurans]
MIERVTRVLEAFKSGGGPLTASEVARQAGIPGPSAHRIVAELTETGVLDRDPDRRLRIGMKLWEIVARSSGVFTLSEAAAPYMEDLRSVVDAPTLLSILDHDDVLNVATLPARHPVATNVTQPGIRLPALASSPGIVLTAFASPEVRDRILETARITRFTADTVVERQDLVRIAHEVRRTGHIIARSWMSPDAVGVAVPVLADDGTALAALSVTTPSNTRTQSSLLPALHTTARGIARAFLAGNAPADPRLTILLHRIRLATDKP